MPHELDQIFAALADPTRRRVVELLAAGKPLTTKEIALFFPITRWAVMKHLVVLRNARLVQTFPEGRRRLHFADRSRFTAVREWLSRLGGVL